MKKIRSFVASLFISICLSLLPSQGYSQQTTSAYNGLQWLTSVQQVDGSWGDWTSPIVRNTASAAEAFQILDQTSPSYAAALQWLKTAGSTNNDNVSRRLYLFSKTNNDITADLNYLLSARKSDGGWGLDSENESGVINTSLALQALKAANYSDTTVLYQAINYLITNQNTDGGWGFYKGNPSNVYVTAIVLRTLAAYDSIFKIQDSKLKASACVITKQNRDGGCATSTISEVGLEFFCHI